MALPLNSLYQYNTRVNEDIQYSKICRMVDSQGQKLSTSFERHVHTLLNPHKKTTTILSRNIFPTASKFSAIVIPGSSSAQLGSHPTITIRDANVTLRTKTTWAASVTHDIRLPSVSCSETTHHLTTSGTNTQTWVRFGRKRIWGYCTAFSLVTWPRARSASSLELPLFLIMVFEPLEGDGMLEIWSSCWVVFSNRIKCWVEHKQN